MGPISAPVYGFAFNAQGITLLGDEPLNTRNSAKPNIVFTADDSTSMLFDFLPDYVASAFCRGGLGAMTANCASTGAANDFTLVGGGKYLSPGYTYQQYAIPYATYVPGYDASGPGSGCQPGSPPTCSPGIDPGAPPGIAQYGAGPQPTWPNAFQPYEYWLLWPAPAHSAALNTLYYDPRIVYDPPVDSTGASYPQMDDAGSATWTQVPSDPWAATITYVDLTAKVNIGQWCNTDWSIGLAPTNPTDPNFGQYCRVNGSGAGAFSTVSASQGTDYTYPWAPPAFTLSPSAGATTSLSYAAQKVTLNGTLTGTAISAAWSGSPTPKDSKYFYENENIIWCDPTNPSWPQTGPTVGQTCGSYVNQSCSAIAQVCVKPTGACNGAVTGACNGAFVGTCNGTAPAACNGNAGVCNNVPTCNSPGCGNLRPQTCNGVSQTCPTNPQTCSGPLAQVCNLPGTQTCQPPTCSITYSPPGCNLLPPDPENPCTPTTTCGPPTCTTDPGTCSITKSSCTSNANCPAQPGACSLTGKSCMGVADCPATGNCSVLGNTCQSVSDCAILGGTCSVKGNACTKNTDCANTGICGGGGSTNGTVCLVPSDCYYCSTGAKQACPSGLATDCTAGSCNQRVCPDGVKPCTTNANCTGIGNGVCQPAASCFANNTCPIQGGTCALGGAGCTSSGQCSATPGTCSKQNGQPWSQKPCTDPSQCLTLGTCNTNGASCTVSTQCPNQAGTCAKDPSVPCNGPGDCSNNGTCANTHSSCNSNVPCANIPGNCSITNAACTTIGAAPQNDPVCPAIGKCSITGARCDFLGGNSECPDQPGPLPPSAAVCSTGGVGGNAATTLRHDADNNGVVCRRNNHTGGGYTSGAYDYPSGKFLTPITNGTGADACPATNHYVSVPRHYWKAEAQWCDKKIPAGDQWAGYGTDVGGTCQPGKDSTHIYPRFFQFGSASYVNNYNTAAFNRVDLDIAKRATATYTHTWVDSNGQTQTITRSFDQEMTNYANWFAYYRTRIQALKTVTALTFNVLDNQYRVGFHTLSNGATVAQFVDVQDFDSVQKAKWFGQLFDVTIPLKIETPTLDAMQRIGDYFSPGGSAALTGATDPIILSCQKNWHMLFTDGFTNQSNPTSTVGDQDDSIPVLPINGTPIAVAGLTPGQPWPHPYREDPSGMASNAASDHSMAFWATDLRPSGPESQDNVPATNKDPATWQHLNFAALSLGTQGKLPIANQSLTENLLSAGTLQWPQPYPNVYRPDNSGVDDLWHAAVNGRGRFVNAQTAAELKLGMGQILQDITNQAGSRAGVGLASSSISPTNNAVYRVTFQPGWGGTVDKFTVDPVTGVQSATPIWQAHVQLGKALTIVNPGDTPWFTNRNIFTIDDAGAALPFLFGNLSAAQQDSLAPGQPAIASSVLEFLRGNPTNEGVALGQFRVRATDSFGENFLGDIIDSRAVYIGPPNWPYLDANDPGYSGFVSSKSSRLAMIYAGANEGMLHAFKDTTGDEAWAFVPHDLYRPDNTGLGALAYQDGALPPFRHHYYVDSTPRIVDVNFGGGSGDWHTLAVGGLGKGGHSYYALDVTDPAAVTDETTAAKQYLWTWTDADMGYTYGQGFIAKTRAFCSGGLGNCPTGGDWVVVIPVGYDNPSGKGKIFFVNAKDGTLLKTMSTGFGDASNPSGLAQINGYTQDFHNQLVDQIYGGDLYGNFWRFNVMDPDPANWTVDKLAVFKDPGGNVQPVTTPPKMEVDITNGVDRWVFIGTGRLLDPTDLTNTLIDDQQQTFYAIRDGTTTTPTAAATPLLRTDLVPLATAAEKINGLTSKPDKGWFDDLPAGQRVVAPVQAALSLVAYAGTSPQDNPCLTGQPATLYVRTFSLGESLLFDAGGVRTGGVAESEGAVGLDITIFTSGSGGNTAGGIDVRIAVTAGTTGNVFFQQIVPPPNLAAHRMSWRLLGQ
jgi:type IV pilus assembly protein PilY1